MSPCKSLRQRLRDDRTLAIVVALCWLAHALAHVRDHSTHELYWACNVSALAIALGLTMRWHSVTSAATLWLVAGTPLWLLDLAGGGAFLPTSLLTHGVVLSLSIARLRRVGIAQESWWMALLGGALLQQISRWMTHWRHNVNVSWGIYPVARGWFANYPRYWIASFALMGAIYALLTYAITRWHQRTQPHRKTPAES
ncbi:MAG: hypothetical protein Q8Q09_10065 [Deltaproteobacteria bacterium]|nr:hypothetical protein [Deltaproteobacteria bacterium]